MHISLSRPNMQEALHHPRPRASRYLSTRINGLQRITASWENLSLPAVEGMVWRAPDGKAFDKAGNGGYFDGGAQRKLSCSFEGRVRGLRLPLE
jgi:hypothetical protein